jgi:hypothetical protein
MTLFFAGSCAGLVFLQSVLPPVAVPLAAGLATLAYAGRDLVCAPSRSKRALGALAWTVTGLFHALWVYLATAWGSVLWWTLSAAAWASIGAAVAATARPRWHGVRVPIAVPLGAWIALCLLGWRAR